MLNNGLTVLKYIILFLYFKFQCQYKHVNPVVISIHRDTENDLHIFWNNLCGSMLTEHSSV